jgi:peptidoglycan/xylan/chitin deacetylase (PgdA/CDA1 family)
MYHSVREADRVRPGTSDLSVAAFRRQLDALTDAFEIVDLGALQDPAPDRKRIALTFDDGYRDFYTQVRPLLHEFDAPATAFLVSNFVDGIDRKSQVVNAGHIYDPLTHEEVAEIIDDPLVTIGNHTKTHHHLGRHREQDILQDEIVGAKDELEDRYGVTIDRFSYPDGGYTETAVQVVRESHALAVMDESQRPLLHDEDPVLLPRVDGGLPLPQVEWRLSDANGMVVATLTD